MRHVMVDIETLGTKPGSVILSIGACRFDESGIGERFYRPIDVFDSLMAGLTINPETVEWWQARDAAAKGALRPALPLLEALHAFAGFVVARPSTDPPRLVWAKGPDFDLVLLGAAYDAVGGPRPWKYNATRDVRTILALAPGVRHQNIIEHHALEDAVTQAWDVITAAKQLGRPLSEMV